MGTSAATNFSNAISPENQCKTWYYRIAAYDAAGNISAFSAAASKFMPDLTSPGKPANLHRLTGRRVVEAWLVGLDRQHRGRRLQDRAERQRDGRMTQIGTSTGSGYSDNLSAADQNKTWFLPGAGV